MFHDYASTVTRPFSKKNHESKGQSINQNVQKNIFFYSQNLNLNCYQIKSNHILQGWFKTFK